MEGLKQVKRGEHCQEWEGLQEVGSTIGYAEDCWWQWGPGEKLVLLNQPGTVRWSPRAV